MQSHAHGERQSETHTHDISARGDTVRTKVLIKYMLKVKVHHGPRVHVSTTTSRLQLRDLGGVSQRSCAPSSLTCSELTRRPPLLLECAVRTAHQLDRAAARAPLEGGEAGGGAAHAALLLLRLGNGVGVGVGAGLGWGGSCQACLVVVPQATTTSTTITTTTTAAAAAAAAW